MAYKAYGNQKSITVKLYPEEIEALEVIAKLAGLNGKSGCLREFMKSYIEAALVTIDSGSPTKGLIKHVKNMQRFQKTMRTIEKNSQVENGDLLRDHDIGVLRQAIA
jgi:hypothetical protein